MKKIFRSKVEPLLKIPMIVILIGLEIIMLINGVWSAAGLIFLSLVFIAYLYRNTFYEVTEDGKLKVKSGFLFKREIYISTIKKMNSSKNMAASPALSRDRIEIFYHRYGSIQVSPENKKAFIEALKKINPRIMVDNKV